MLSNRRLHSAKISDAINIEVRVSFYSNIPFIQNEPEAQPIGVIANTNLRSVVMLLYNPFRLIHIGHNISCERRADTKSSFFFSQDHKNTARTLEIVVVLPVGYTSHNSSSDDSLVGIFFPLYLFFSVFINSYGYVSICSSCVDNNIILQCTGSRGKTA